MEADLSSASGHVSIRQLERDDVKWVVSCQPELYTANFQHARITTRFLRSQEQWINDHFNQGDRSAFFVALADDVKAGFIWGKVLDNLLEGPEGLVLQNYVLPGFRGKGIGKRLLSALLAFFEGSNVVKVTLNVTLENEAALALYRSMGFEPVRYEMERRYDQDGSKSRDRQED